MVKIRTGMFETNSSSTHTIIVTESKTEPGAIVDFRIGEFGWEIAKLDTVDEKASYLYTMACELLGRDVYQDLYEVLCKYGVKCSCSRPPVFVHGSYGNYEYLDNGWVDHASEGRDFVDLMLKHEKTLIKYLFNDESYVVTGNDNVWEDEYERIQDLIGKDKINYKYRKFYKGN